MLISGAPMQVAMRVSRAVGIVLVVMLAAAGSALGAAQELAAAQDAQADYEANSAYCGLALVAVDLLGFYEVVTIATLFFAVSIDYVSGFLYYCRGQGP